MLWSEWAKKEEEEKAKHQFSAFCEKKNQTFCEKEDRTKPHKNQIFWEKEERTTDKFSAFVNIVI